MVLDKYWVTQSGYFRLATEVALGMGITYGKLLYCHGVEVGNVDKKISKMEYNNRTFYACFNNLFTDKFGSPYSNPPPIIIYDRPHQHKRSRYTLYLISSSIYVVSVNSFSTLTTISNYPDLLTYYDPNTLNVMNKCVTF